MSRPNWCRDRGTWCLGVAVIAAGDSGEGAREFTCTGGTMDLDDEAAGDITCEGLDQAELMAMIGLQLSEVDMLQSMFPGPRELVVDDPSVLCDLRDFAEGRTLLLPPRLDLVINLDVEKGRVNMSINLPHEYPAAQPSIFVRSQTLSRQAQHRLNQELREYIKTLQKGDLCIGPAVTWLQEKGESFFDDLVDTHDDDQATVETKNYKCARLWIYSHHIYSKVKRKDILDLSREFDLTGFCLPGKPGIICVEGLAHNTDDWWQKVRSWNWQKILVKKREEEDHPGSSHDLATFRRFPTFQELGTDNSIRVKSGGTHVNMGDVFRYLDEHGCGYVFRDYFGINGRPT
ncbi:hypothetical protein Pmani_012052 [Petrolisthes manimaculis]|uniref:RWD domain-containing protein n=1 Tax=Petrolisthes manimaculis TaxID=1843537 RepID=A0AAE1PYF3_9EUCA|nr:hypothetical protein Pmani_012052 [Petrolisthes manimaculis]